MIEPPKKDRKYEFVWVLFQLRALLYKVREKELLAYGVKPRQAAVLVVMAAIGEQATPAEISRWLLREPHSVSGILDRMEKKGLIRRVKNLEKKNMIRVTFTEKGRQAYRIVRRKGVWHKIVGILSDEEQELLTQSLNKIHEKVLKVSGMKKPPFPESV